MVKKTTRRHKLLSVPGGLYEGLAQSGVKAGFENPNRYLAHLLKSAGFDTEDVKLIFRVPLEISADPEQCKAYLHAQVEKAVKKMFDPEPKA